jgi:hypothetical protein
MRFSPVLAALAVAAVLAAFAALAYAAYTVINGLWAMFLSLVLVAVIGVGGDPSAAPPTYLG